MADPVDRAQSIIDLGLAVSVSSARGAISTGPGQEFCQHCDEQIPVARRKAVPGCQLCIHCQQAVEKEE